MITKENLKTLLSYFNFTECNNVYKRDYKTGASIEVDINKQKITYSPVDDSFENGEFPTKSHQSKGFVIHRDTTLNLKSNENFVCLVCVHLLLEKGYEAKHIVFEPAFKVGHINKPSYGDILVFDKEYKPLVLIENKTFGSEFSKEWNNMQKDGGQLFSYLGPLVNELGFCENLVLFAADFDEIAVLKSNIVTLKDNEKRLGELDNPKSFANAQGKYFEVWNETYAKSFETKGLFEDDIAAYTIGKLKYTINDLKELSHAEIRPIYHEFATILRNNAITDFEHSFYILIDLFLCKIADEKNNPNDLQFYYKGITRDTPKEYCARLLNLYKLGKKQLFDVNVVNKEESDIKQIFEDTNRSITNGLFAGIKELFEEMKFYNIKKFNFIDVENKEDFELNFQILIKIAALIQDINLSNSETNHFFGDLFEGLLSKNVHQTEGQFFTPLPIVNFIIKSLPQYPNSNAIKVLDYACGAGHFLTEFVKSYPNAKVYGIEKSQPLSQVAKIATIINGSKESHIVFSDALSDLNTNEVRYQGFDKESFDCIIANPPYSVKGFLNTLKGTDRTQFSLLHCVKENTYETNKKIECFFVERSVHFLKQNGLIAIVLPSSILDNTDKLYKGVRELLFAHFNILSIVSLGSRTFGSTGTNTIILFAQRMKKNAEGLLHAFVEKNDYTQYLSHKAIDSYIAMQGYSKKEYFEFMQDDILKENLENHEMFVDYKKDFKSKPITKTLETEWFKSSSFCNAELKEKSKEYKKQFTNFQESAEYKNLENQEIRKQFVSFAKEIESDKLNTYIQIENNCVAILLSPSDKVGDISNKAQIVKFLGYDWSKRKGDEGIKYITSMVLADNEDDKDDKDAEVANAINSIKYIDTPLYNPNDDYDVTKFAFAIRKHIEAQCSKFSFSKESNNLLNNEYNGKMSELLSYVKLSDMLDFTRTTFDKAIRTSVTKKVEVKSKYELVKLGDVAEIYKGVNFEKDEQTSEKTNKIVLTADNITLDGKFELTKQVYVLDKVAFDDSKKLMKDDCFICFSSGSRNHVGKVAYITENTEYYAGGFMGILRSNKAKLIPRFLYEILNTPDFREIVKNSATGSNILNLSNAIVELELPLPPKVIQEQIVCECEKIDTDYKNAKEKIENCKQKIESIMENVQKETRKTKTLENLLVEVTGNKTKIEQKEIQNSGKYPVITQESDNLIYGYTNIEECITDLPLIVFGDHTCVFKYVDFKFVRGADGTQLLKCNENEILTKFLYYFLQGLKIYNAGKYERHFKYLKTVEIPIPPLETQKQIVAQITAIENEIQKAKDVMAQSAELKAEVLKKYLE